MITSSDWTETDIDPQRVDDTYFSRHLHFLLHELARSCEATRGYAAVTGLAVGKFMAADVLGDFAAGAVEADIAGEVRAFTTAPTLPTETVRDNELFVPLIGKGELFGFIKLWAANAERAKRALQHRLQHLLDELSDHNYTRRVRVLSKPFTEVDQGNLKLDVDSTERRIAENTALSFGADGALLRRYVEETNTLKVTQYEGEVPVEFLSDRAEGEMIAGALISSETHKWCVIEFHSPVSVRGCRVSDQTIATLRRIGVRAIISARLDNPLDPAGPPFGTLAYFFKRPSQFSWRDITLFLGFCSRASDALALARERSALMEQNKFLEVQSNIFTQAEVATLLVHDISHKVFHVGENGTHLSETTKKAIKNYRAQIPADVAAAQEDLQEAVRDLQREVTELKAVGRWDDGQEGELRATTFSLLDLVEDLISTMKSPLSRYNITPRVEVAKDLTVSGSRKVLQHVMLNLLLNSVDAAKNRTHSRPMTIHISAQQEAEMIRIRFWDTGPGINTTKFPNATDIFKVGATSKKIGTGLGLPMARNLLTRYFTGSLDLLDARSALFEMRISKQND